MTRKQRKRRRKQRQLMMTPRKKRKSNKIPRGYSKHHRKCRSNGGGNENSNISIVPHQCHVAWHVLFSNLDAYAIAQLVNQKYLDPAYRFKVEETNLHV